MGLSNKNYLFHRKICAEKINTKINISSALGKVILKRSCMKNGMVKRNNENMHKNTLLKLPCIN